MIRFAFCILAFLWVAIPVSAQNLPEFFRRYPYPGEFTPDWAAKMYGASPNFFEVMDLRREYYLGHPYTRDIHERNFEHWTKSVLDRILEDGSIGVRPLPPVQQESNKMGSGGWECIGPKETYNLGSEGSFPVSWQTNVYSMDQSVTNPDILVAGTEAGDLFKTTDHGLNWFPITEGLNARTITAAAIAPSNANHIWFCAGNTHILYRSTDGGASWQSKLTLSNSIDEIAIHPTNPNLVMVGFGTGMSRSTDGGTTWTQLHTERVWDIKFHPTNSNLVYLLRKNTAAKTMEFLRSTDIGATWTQQTAGWYVPADPVNAVAEGGHIAVTPAAPNRVYVSLLGQSKAGDNGWIGLYVSSNTGQNWVNPIGQDGGPYNGTTLQNLASSGTNGSGFNQGFYNHGLGVSSTDSNRIWVGTVALSQTTNGGASWVRIGGYNQATGTLSWIHPDVQKILVRGNNIWVASDGGINYSTNELTSHESRKKGITGSDFWGYGQGWNHDIMVGGRYHNGNSGYFQTYGTGNTLRLGGGESPTGHVNPLVERRVYFNDVSDKVLPSTLSGALTNSASMQAYPNASYVSFESSEMVFHPWYASKVYIGRDSSIFVSDNEGLTYSVLKTFPGRGQVYALEICANNPQVMYATVRPNSNYYTWTVIQKTTDGGLNWVQLPNPAAANRMRMRISVNPANENEIWVISAGYSYVYRSTNGGTTWQNMETSVLSGQYLRDIAFQGGGNTAYLASSTDVFYYDANASNWVNYRAGLPVNVPTLTLEPFYRDGKMRLSTNGKAVWEREFANPSQCFAVPMTYSAQSECARDTIQFGCHSVLNHTGATWNWTFSPTPQYVSSGNGPNPKVVFGNSGSYSVTLTITDGLGNTSTRTVPNMVAVSNACNPDTIPGRAMTTFTNGDFATTSGMNLTTNTYTVTAWVKPNGVQPDYTGIVMGDGSGAAGFNFRGGNNTLGYHWPTTGAWWWNSGLVVPANEWSYIALVISPSAATVYVNGVSASDNFPMNAANITQLYIGSYLGWTSRNFNGQIDEVRIWNRSLSRNEIRELRHLILDSTYISNDPTLLAYYQFNEVNGRILDRVGSYHANPAGGMQRWPSTVPVGKGESNRQSIISFGTYNFGNTQSALTWSSGSPLPNGEVVLTRIHNMPDSLPNGGNSVPGYFILNSYGLSSFAQPTQFSLRPFAHTVPLSVQSGAAHGNLFNRPQNEFRNNWANGCGSNSANANSYQFATGCGFTQSLQLFLSTSDCYAATQTVSACAGDTAYFHGVPVPPNTTIYVGANAGTYCDTVYTVSATTGQYNSLAYSVDLCDGDSIFAGGNWQTQPGIYIDTLSGSVGCDTILTRTVTVTSPDAGNTWNGTLFTANTGGQSYQWINCVTGQAIAGETASSFAPSQSGTYALLATINGCTDTSACQSVVIVGIEDPESAFRVYPNPIGQGQPWNIETTFAGQMRVNLFDARGKHIQEWLVQGPKAQIELGNLAKGVYFWQIYSPKAIQNGKLTVE